MIEAARKRAKENVLRLTDRKAGTVLNSGHKLD